VKRSVDVTPELATTWLARDAAADHVVNRNPSLHRVDRYARDMSTGHWLDTFIPLIIDWDGYVRDGRHRLMAIVRSGVTIRFEVVFNADPIIQKVVDRQRPRSIADDVRMRGMANAMVVSSAASLVMRWRSGKIFSTAWIPTSLEADEFINETKDTLDDAAREATRIARNVPGLSKSVLAAAYHEARIIDPEACTEFFESLYLGANLPITSPILALSRVITRYGTSAGSRRAGSPRKPRQEYQLHHVVRAWNLWREEPEPEKKRMIDFIPKNLTSETFPRMK
jgi:hypothetical protein